MGYRRYYRLSSLIWAMKKNKDAFKEWNDIKEVIAALEKEGWYLSSSSTYDRDPEDDTGGELEDYGDDDG